MATEAIPGATQKVRRGYLALDYHGNRPCKAKHDKAVIEELVFGTNPQHVQTDGALACDGRGVMMPANSLITKIGLGTVSCYYHDEMCAGKNHSAVISMALDGGSEGS